MSSRHIPRCAIRKQTRLTQLIDFESALVIDDDRLITTLSLPLE